MSGMQAGRQAGRPEDGRAGRPEPARQPADQPPCQPANRPANKPANAADIPTTAREEAGEPKPEPRDTSQAPAHGATQGRPGRRDRWRLYRSRHQRVVRAKRATLTWWVKGNTLPTSVNAGVSAKTGRRKPRGDT